LTINKLWKKVYFFVQIVVDRLGISW